MEQGISMAEIDSMDVLWFLEVMAWKTGAEQKPEAKFLREMLR